MPSEKAVANRVCPRFSSRPRRAQLLLRNNSNPTEEAMRKNPHSSTPALNRGKTFEDEVANLYRLLGADVIQNIEICQKKVDIFASFPIQGGPTKHRIIVECKDEKRVVNAN